MNAPAGTRTLSNIYKCKSLIIQMKRLSKDEILRINNLIKEGKSLNHISSLTNKNKSTLYHHYKKLMGKKNKDIELNFSDDDFIGELIGLFVGDGYLFYNKKKWNLFNSFIF